MNTLEIDILNPKAEKLLDDLAELNLIAIRPIPENTFLHAVKKFRDKAKANPVSLEEITQEVESVRTKRYASKNKS